MFEALSVTALKPCTLEYEIYQELFQIQIRCSHQYGCLTCTCMQEHLPAVTRNEMAPQTIAMHAPAAPVQVAGFVEHCIFSRMDFKELTAAVL